MILQSAKALGRHILHLPAFPMPDIDETTLHQNHGLSMGKMGFFLTNRELNGSGILRSLFWILIF